MSDKATLCLPAACGGWMETGAAYRFFNNDKTDAAKVLKPHHDATVQRMRRHDVVIVAQDATEMELVPTQERVGGPLSHESRWGLYIHPLMAIMREQAPGSEHAQSSSKHGPFTTGRMRMHPINSD